MRKQAENKTNPPNCEFAIVQCPGEDLNFHPRKDTALNRARLPIPPPGQSKDYYTVM